jgi:O-antigen ligase
VIELIILSSVFTSIPIFYLSFIGISSIQIFRNVLLTKKINSISFIILTFLIYLTVHIVFISQINIFDLIDLKYLRTEGRIFFTFIPFIYFSTFYFSKSVFFRKTKWFYNIFFMYGILCLFHILQIIDISFFFTDGGGILFKGFFSSKNAAGNFMGVFFAISIFYYKELSFKNIVILSVCFLPFLLASSRQGYVALLFSLIYIFFFSSFKINVKKILVEHYKVFFIIFTFFFIVVINVPDLNNRILNISFNSNSVGNFNILWRLSAWIQSFVFFLDSPIFGIGVNRFGDFSKDFIGIPGIFYFAVDGVQDWKSHYIHAHNLYFNTLAEQGIVGLSFLMYIFYKIYYYFDERIYLDRKVAELGKVVIIYSIISGLFGNGIEAPSSGLPFGLFCGFAYNYLERKIKE